MKVDVLLSRRGGKSKHQFYKIYEMENNSFGKSEKKIFLGDKSNRFCRFCGEGKEKTSFKFKAHVLPEFTGNKKLFSYFECDNCNSIFSSYEDALSRYCGLLNTMALLKGKRGVPKHKSSSKELEIFEEQGNIRIRLILKNRNQLEKFKELKIDKEKGIITIESQKQSYVPKHVLKALVKIGMCLINESDLNHFDRTIKWLLNQYDDSGFDDYLFFSIFENHLPRPLHVPEAILFRKRKIFEHLACPDKVLIVTFGVFIFQILLPFNKADDWLLNLDEILVPLEEHLSEIIDETEKTAQVKVNVVDLSHEELRVGEMNFFTSKIKEKK